MQGEGNVARFTIANAIRVAGRIIVGQHQQHRLGHGDTDPVIVPEAVTKGVDQAAMRLPVFRHCGG